MNSVAANDYLSGFCNQIQSGILNPDNPPEVFQQSLFRLAMVHFLDDRDLMVELCEDNLFVLLYLLSEEVTHILDFGEPRSYPHELISVLSDMAALLVMNPLRTIMYEQIVDLLIKCRSIT
jgi:hypothetical protein